MKRLCCAIILSILFLSAECFAEGSSWDWWHDWTERSYFYVYTQKKQMNYDWPNSWYTYVQGKYNFSPTIYGLEWDLADRYVSKGRLSNLYLKVKHQPEVKYPRDEESYYENYGYTDAELNTDIRIIGNWNLALGYGLEKRIYDYPEPSAFIGKERWVYDATLNHWRLRTQAELDAAGFTTNPQPMPFADESEWTNHTFTVGVKYYGSAYVDVKYGTSWWPPVYGSVRTIPAEEDWE